MVSIAHFSDLLCIWAYVAQIRIDELKSEFGDQISFNFHYLPVFGSVSDVIEKNWHKKGGVEAFNKHVKAVAAKFDHVDVNDRLWLDNRPSTSISGHLFIKALQLLEIEEELEVGTTEAMTWALREAFFKEAQDISDLNVQIALAEERQLPLDKISNKLNHGEAHAALDKDNQMKANYYVPGSPTLVFNEGRQILYGNVGYRVIQANVRELINQPDNQASWC